MDSKDLKSLLNLVILILFVAGSILGPLVERWRRKKEAARKGAGTGEEEEPPPAPAPARDQDRPQLPYENVLEEVFGPYIERRRRAAEDAKQQAAEEAPEEVDPDEEIRRLREVKRPAEEPATALDVAPEPPRLPLAAGDAASLPPRRSRSLDDLIFRNPRLTPGAKLLLAGEILGPPRSRRR